MALIHSPAGMRFLDMIAYPEIELAQNAFAFITGPSGCGKSTYLKILNRTALPSEKIPDYNGKAIDVYPVLAYRKEVLLTPQEVFLCDGAIRDNFYFYYDAREQARPTDERMLKFLGICRADFARESMPDGAGSGVASGGALDLDCGALSGGEKQRVFLSIFLSFMPKVLLLDEPTAALDEMTAMELLANVREFCKASGITAVCVCHNEALVEKFSDCTIRLEARA